MDPNIGDYKASAGAPYPGPPGMYSTTLMESIHGGQAPVPVPGQHTASGPSYYQNAPNIPYYFNPQQSSQQQQAGHGHGPGPGSSTGQPPVQGLAPLPPPQIPPPPPQQQQQQQQQIFTRHQSPSTTSQSNIQGQEQPYPTYGAATQYYQPVTSNRMIPQQPTTPFPPPQRQYPQQQQQLMQQQERTPVSSNQSGIQEQPNMKKRLHSNATGPNTSRVAATYPRKRALTACDTCRFKKIKCDNDRPRCGSCVKSGNETCHYRIDDQSRDYSTFDAASLNILTKLDTVLQDLKEIKQEKTSIINSRNRKGSPTVKYQFDNCFWDMGATNVLDWNYFRKCTGVPEKTLREDRKKLLNGFSKNNLETNIGTVEEKIKVFQAIDKFITENHMAMTHSYLLNFNTKAPIIDVQILLEYVEFFQMLFKVMPGMSFLNYVESVQNIPKDEFDTYTPIEFELALSNVNVKNKSFYLRTYTKYCDRIPSALMVLAIGTLSTSMQLENIAKFSTSLEERTNVTTGCLSEDGLFDKQPDNLPRDRGKISIYIVQYAEYLYSMFPNSMLSTEFEVAKYEILKSQYYLCTFNVLDAFKQISRASHNLMFYLNSTRETVPLDGDEDSTCEEFVDQERAQQQTLGEEAKAIDDLKENEGNILGKETELDLSTKNEVNDTNIDTTIDMNVTNKGYSPIVLKRQKGSVERVFWICLKLESEIRAELSPNIPLSGITKFPPPSSLPSIPCNQDLDLLLQDKKFMETHSESAVRLAARFEDEDSWYYFLTEIAVRKVDNKMYDEVFSHDNITNSTWDTEEFANETLWVTFIKYWNQYNGIINSLAPHIREFILHETDVQQAHKRVKKMYLHRKSKMEDEKSVTLIESDDRKMNVPLKTNDIGTGGDFRSTFDDLDDFALEDEIPLHSQSESIMFIKTRILTSKLVLIRPIVYLILEDKIEFQDLLLVIIEVMEDQITGRIPVGCQESPASLISFDSTPQFKGGYRNYANAPPVYQREYPDEDFSQFIFPESDDSSLSSDDIPEIKLKDVPGAKIRILKVFMKNLIAMPKQNIANLASHRHAGLWYVLRNSFLGHVIEFLLYKKVHEMLAKASEDEYFKEYLTNRENPISPEGVLGIINMILSKERIQASLEHLQVLFEYWQHESSDCKIYQNYISMCLNNL